jgi:hypothetical protein
MHPASRVIAKLDFTVHANDVLRKSTLREHVRSLDLLRQFGCKVRHLVPGGVRELRQA